MELDLIKSQDNFIVKRYDTCVILHLTHPDLWKAIFLYLLNLEQHFDLFVTIPYQVEIQENTIREDFPEAQIYRCENRGLDIEPFLAIFSVISKLGYKYICKVHTGKSPHILNGFDWAQDMLGKLLGSQKIISKIKKAFNENPDWGLIAPEGYVAPNNLFWGPNAAKLIMLAESAGIPTNNLQFSFVVGSMFWFRPESFDLLLNPSIVAQDFDLEHGQLDGTVAHAFELFFGMVSSYAGYKIAESNLNEIKLSGVSAHFRFLLQLSNYQDHMIKAQVAEKDRTVQTLSALVEEKEGALTFYKNILGQKEIYIKNLEIVIESIYRSTSWKISKPVRDAKTFARKIKRLTYSIVRRTGAVIYRVIPVSLETKLRLREGAFRRFGFSSGLQLNKALQPPVALFTDIPQSETKSFRNPNIVINENQYFRPERIIDRQKISVIITSFNHEKYIRQCVDSILAQKGNYDLEIILGDDCSTDNTYEILRQYSEIYPYVFKMMPKQPNIGVTKNLKRCLDACRGDFIAICEGDDYWTDEYKLQKQMQFLWDHKDYSMCFSSFMIFYEDENRLSLFDDPILLKKDELTTEDLVHNNFIGNFSCCMYWTDVVRKLPKEIFEVFTVDWMFNMACGEIGKIGFISDCMSVYRKHSGGAWSGKPVTEQVTRLLVLIDIYDKLLDYKYHNLFIKYKAKLNQLANVQKDLLILDTVFPHPLSPFRYQEFISYLDHFSSSLVLTTGEHFSSFFESRSVAEVILEFEKEHPEYKGRTIVTSHDIEPYNAKLAYVVFLYNMKLFLETLEKKRIPFVFTLYPGAAFELNKPLSDDALVKIFNSPQFRKVIVTQKITYDYLIQKKFCKPDQIEFIYGVVTPLNLIKPYTGKKFFGYEKDTLDICFVSHKYMPKGLDKGYDVFIDVAKILTKIHNNIHFHVVGSFTEADIPTDGLEGKITFYGLQRNEWFDSFYLDKDIILSPNIPFKIVGVDGAFDGFPTASCTEAGLRKVAVFCTDELHLNVKFTNEEDLVVIPHDSEKIAELIEFYYSNPAKLRKLAESGSAKFSNVYNYENQILPRIRIIETELRKKEKFFKSGMRAIQAKLPDLNIFNGKPVEAQENFEPDALDKNHRQPLDVAILDDIFPHPLSAFRMQEFTSYLEEFKDLEIYSTGASVVLLGEKTFDEIMADFKIKNPLYAGRVKNLKDVPIINAKLIYSVFLINVYLNIEKIEELKTPFVFTLYPGGGFGLNIADSDRMLRRVMRSPCFRKVIVTQRVTYNYLVDNHYCAPEQIKFIFGVVTPLDQITSEYLDKKHFGLDKKDLDICFVAYKYTERGIDKGYDIFIEVARQLCQNHDDIRFHIVGGIDEHEIDVTDLKGKISFYGKRDMEWFDTFYKDKDIILSPNIPGTMYPGSFDGFPTGSCVDAGLRKTAIFCTDELGLNKKFFSEEDEIVIIPHDAAKITSIIEGYYNNPEKLKAISENGRLRIKQLFNYDTQILPRINILKKEIKQAETSKKTIYDKMNDPSYKKPVHHNIIGKSIMKNIVFSIKSLAKGDPKPIITRAKTMKDSKVFSQILGVLAPSHSARDKVLRRIYDNSFVRFRNFLRNQKGMKDLALIRSSELFDKDWYLANNLDVAQANMDPALHYWCFGGIEGRDPGPNFYSNGYLDTYEDVKKARVNPLLHYLKYGRKEGRLIPQRQRIEINDLPYSCPVCEEKVKEFTPLSSYYDDNWNKYGFPYKSNDFETLNSNQYFCPKCGASDRERLYALYLTGTIKQNIPGDPITILDIAPGLPLKTFLLKHSNIKYQSADKYMKDVDLAVDIMDMNMIHKETYDFFICSHVLEHVTDDRKALSELFRILKPGGAGILMVPINLRINKIEEDPSVTDIGERWRRFAQDDHIRLYSKIGFVERVEDAGFKLNQYGIDFFGKDAFFQHGISTKSMLYIVEKK